MMRSSKGLRQVALRTCIGVDHVKTKNKTVMNCVGDNFLPVFTIDLFI